MDTGRPYTDLEITDKYIIREFNENIDPIELLWHRDDEDRLIEIIGDTDWSIQLEKCSLFDLQSLKELHLKFRLKLNLQQSLLSHLNLFPIQFQFH